MRHWLPTFLATALCLSVAGCRTTEVPSLCCPPGPVDYQQQKAQRFDPYAEPGIAPFADGTRPRDYQNPVAEPSRARWDPRTWVRRFGR
jgi:hypothetical protein